MKKIYKKTNLKIQNKDAYVTSDIDQDLLQDYIDTINNNLKAEFIYVNLGEYLYLVNTEVSINDVIENWDETSDIILVSVSYDTFARLIPNYYIELGNATKYINELNYDLY